MCKFEDGVAGKETQRIILEFKTSTKYEILSRRSTNKAYENTNERSDLRIWRFEDEATGKETQRIILEFKTSTKYEILSRRSTNKEYENTNEGE